MVTLGQIALTAQKLDVGVRVSAALGDWDNVVELQVGVSAAFGTATTVSLPNPLANVS